MNFSPILASLENLLVLLAFVVLSVASTWLTKKRSGKEADPGSDEAEPPPSPATQGRAARPADWEEALRRLLGGEPSPQVPPPLPIPSARRDKVPSPVGADEESYTPEWSEPRETSESYDGAVEHADSTAAPPRPGAALAHATVASDEASERPEKATRLLQKLDAAPKRPATVASNRRWRRSPEGVRAVALVRDARTVRQAFVASLVFGPPKALEN
jgi:hypothetical protein